MLVLGAEALAGASRQALYLAAPGVPHLQPVLDIPEGNLVYPLFFRD
jgi:hypothetical protein